MLRLSIKVVLIHVTIEHRILVMMMILLLEHDVWL